MKIHRFFYFVIIMLQGDLFLRMILYFEFDERRVLAEVSWPKDNENITVHVTDKQLARELPTDLYFEIEAGNKVSYTIENPDNKRLIDLQNVIKRRLQEFVNKF